MSTFKASNGIVIHPRKDQDSHLGIQTGASIFSLSRLEAEAVREYFQHERDQELERWRWPGDHDIVVYPERKGSVFCFDEATGEGAFGKRDSFDEGNYWDHVARAYFEAHPEKYPWHDAQPGEVWEVTRAGEEPRACQALSTGKFLPVQTVHAWQPPAFSITDPNITAGRRIWPETEEGDTYE